MKNAYDLLIEPVVTAKNRRILLFFKPKEVVENSEFDFKLKITNKTGRSFPGGLIEDISAVNFKEKIMFNFDNERIPGIASHESRIIDISPCLAISSGLLRFSCKIKPDDNKPTNYYQKDKIKGSSEKVSENEWEDTINITSRYEINQRYTNYILSIMTLLLICFAIIQILKPS